MAVETYVHSGIFAHISSISKKKRFEYTKKTCDFFFFFYLIVFLFHKGFWGDQSSLPLNLYDFEQ